MAELEIDQSHLPRVQEVCQSFSVLEDGVLAHNLQEQEIEQYYTTNIQKNQLVQNDIRMAKRLQDEEQQRAQQSVLHRQASRQIEEQDFEYARVIQEEIQRCDEEAWRREQDDEEIAKRMQEEEEQRIRRSSRELEGHSESTGALLQPEVNRASLDMGELQQVLQDEELARKLQEEEESLLRRSSPTSSYPPGDFRVAQVAQDEEIARFMQKQEIKSKRRSRELEGPASWREHRAMISHHERRAARERQIQRERLDSEGLPSPSDDFPPENLPPSPVCTTPPAQQIRNIAEELDPTFQARRQGTDSLQMGQPGPTCQPLPVPPSDVHDFLEPTFVPPTKRQSEKAGRTKTKEKKEACKQQ
ncbi:coiled-coil domain-containing protein 187 isoform X5 [Thalassophryne amazonica]|uniref:coiled-coil domain-containing protein 187 isoform X5 n=1 Tax=Thalassophryne amazonica TaxID=390379 RepID=UPI001471D31C|nr:coiled-coil domain-containing protein 187 isoform X5 [Thalassophryne amazonica]